MIKKIISNFFLFSFLLIILVLTLLSTVGIETDRFNKLISNKIDQSKDIKLELKTINFKLDLKELSLFLETQQPKINYRNILIPAQNVRVYIDFSTLIKADLKIEKINLVLDTIDINQLNILSRFIKPSNFKNFLNNKITGGKLISEIEIFFNNGSINNYIIKGDVKNLEANIFKNINLSRLNFSFFADNEDILIKNIFGNLDNIKIAEGDIKLNLEKGIKLDSNFNTTIKLDDEILRKYTKLFNNFKYYKSIKFLKGNFRNNIFVELDDTYKVRNYDYRLFGKIEKSKLQLPNSIKSSLLNQEIKAIHLSNTEIQSNLSPKNFKISGEGKYSLNNLVFSDFQIENKFNAKDLNLNANLDYNGDFNIDFINYAKKKNNTANISFELEKKKDFINFKRLDYKEKDDFIKLDDLKIEKNNFISLKKFYIKSPNNNFSIEWNKKILIKGTKFDASNLPKFLSEKNNKNIFSKINKIIEIDFENIKAPVSEKLENFRLIGEIQKGKFVKISSKGDFGSNNFIDIAMKTDEKTNKSFLEIYSDLPRPLLTEYNFFKGLSGGKLFYTSLIEGSKSNSKLKIEKFKVINAPGVIQILSLADLGGLADLAEGEGLSFDLLEISMEKDENLLKLNEILALGPSISVLMEGYQDKDGLTSLKGTLVPAKTLNKMISKIPVIGNIVIPKEVGEGLFGISFKMKGPKGKIKTTINPIRTLTPRFIQKIIDRNKITK